MYIYNTILGLAAHRDGNPLATERTEERESTNRQTTAQILRYF